MSQESTSDLLTSVSRLTAVLGRERLLREALAGTIPMGRAARGNRGFVVHVSKDDPAEFMLIEHWTDEDALAKHKKDPGMVRAMALVKQQALVKIGPVETHWTQFE